MPDGGEWLVDLFWKLRGFCSDHSQAVMPSLVNDWIACSGVSLSRADHSIIYEMDRAFRSQYPKTVQFHEARRNAMKGK